MGTIWFLERIEGYSSRLKPTLLKFSSEKQQNLEAPSFETWPNCLAACLPTSLFLAAPTYLLRLWWWCVKYLAMCLCRYSKHTDSFLHTAQKKSLKNHRHIKRLVIDIHCKSRSHGSNIDHSTLWFVSNWLRGSLSDF